MPTIAELTPHQHAAVEHFEGPLLILAGPGSGKTRVITHRIARLLERGVSPWNILAITFTNKAADEMAGRVKALVPGSRVWISTFHRFCSRLLRERAELVGLQPNFSILDSSEQRALVGQIVQAQGYDTVHYQPAKIAARISRAKNDLITAEDFAAGGATYGVSDIDAVVARVFPEYQRAMLRANSVDFDDLLLHVVKLLQESPELRRDLDQRYHHILVDEYQDTNLTQYRLIAGLSQDYSNLCVSGDPDQSIYGWRGAQIDNILRFESDFPSATLIKLEHNFRSTARILEAADSLIGHNVLRKEKSLLTHNPAGAAVELLRFSNGLHEADAIAQDIRAQVEAGHRNWSDFALFYRVNAHSRELELAFGRHGVPFQIVAGVAFYERAEIKDLLAYLRLIVNPLDASAFRRVVNQPLRGIGKTTQNRLFRWADQQGLGPLEAAGRAKEIPELSKSAATKLRSFASMIGGLQYAGSVTELLGQVIDRTRYAKLWELSTTEKDLQRKANVRELVTTAHRYDVAHEDDGTLEGFLEGCSLAGDVDALDQSSGQVVLMTLHAAKGLEFPVVYIVAVEQGLIPHDRAMNAESSRDLEEERRLLFVGMTRAQQRLYLTETHRREIFGREVPTIRSMFLREMQLDLIDRTSDAVQPVPWKDAPSDETAEKTAAQLRHEAARARAAAGRPLLTTAAALLNGTHDAEDTAPAFLVGMSVRHPRYGVGTVLESSGGAQRQILKVRFDEAERTETFIAAKCPLQPIGLR